MGIDVGTSHILHFYAGIIEYFQTSFSILKWIPVFQISYVVFS